jgi:hypothetical protein
MSSSDAVASDPDVMCAMSDSDSGAAKNCRAETVPDVASLVLVDPTCQTASAIATEAQTCPLSVSSSDGSGDRSEPIHVDYGRKATFRRALHALLNEDEPAFTAVLADDPSTLLETADEFPLLLYMYGRGCISIRPFQVASSSLVLMPMSV